VIDHSSESTRSLRSVHLGAAAARLPIWLARQAVRNGELRLGAQQDNLVAMEARATSIFGWSVPSILGLGALGLHSPFVKAAIAAAVCLLGAAIGCVVALWPRPWGHVGHDPKEMLEWELPSELEILESIALGYGNEVLKNDRHLERFANWLRVSWILFIAGPVMGAIGLAVIVWSS
jgi:hypothetical protein